MFCSYGYVELNDSVQFNIYVISHCNKPYITKMDGPLVCIYLV